jgi:hypothetical protein
MQGSRLGVGPNASCPTRRRISLDAIGTLDNLLVRMQAHRSKKRDLLRKLDVAGQGA